MRPFALTLAVAVVLAVAGPTLAQPRPADPGYTLVQRNCAQCHAVGKDGDSPDKAAPPFRNLFMRYSSDTLGKALSEGLLAQHPAMPQFRFAPSEVNQIIRYLKAIQSAQDA